MLPEDFNTNLRAIAKCTGEILASLGVATAAAAQLAGFQSFGQITETGMDIESNPVPFYGSYRGKNKKVKVFSGNNSTGYTFKQAEMNPLNLSLLLSADPDYNYGSEAQDNARSALAGVAGTSLAFSTTAAGLGLWYQLLDASGNAVQDVTAVTITTLVEGTDFEVDYKLGLIRFLTAQAADLSPLLTAAEITSASLNYMKRYKPLQKYTFEGMFMVNWYDEDEDWNVLYHHEPFLGRLQVSTGPQIGNEPLSMESKLEIMDGSFFRSRA